MDLHKKEVLIGSTVAFFLKMIGVCISFIFNVVLARFLGAKDTGIYYLVLSIILVASTISRMGLDNSLLRLGAANVGRADWKSLSGLYSKGITIALFSSSLAAIIIIKYASWISLKIFSNPDLIIPLRFMAVAILPLNLLILHAQLLKSLKKIRDALFLEGIGTYSISILLLFLFCPFYGILGAVISYAAANVIMFVIGLFLWHKATPKINKLRGDFDTSMLMSISLPLFMVASMNLVMGWTDTMLLGIWSDNRSIGIYGVAMRTASLSSFVLMSVNSIFAPKIAALYELKDYKNLKSLSRWSTKLVFFFSNPILIVLVFAPKLVLQFFGQEFLVGKNILIILAVGQFVNVITGPVGYLLMMSGNEKYMRNNTIGCAILNLVLNLVLIPQYGIIGAAIATSISLATMNIISSVLVYWKLSIITLPIPERCCGLKIWKSC